MNQINLDVFLAKLGISPVFAAIILVIVLAWTLYWKGRAMWASANSSEKWWFIAFLIVNTVGILEIIYLYLVLPRSKKVGENK